LVFGQAELEQSKIFLFDEKYTLNLCWTKCSIKNACRDYVLYTLFQWQIGCIAQAVGCLLEGKGKKSGKLIGNVTSVGWTEGSEVCPELKSLDTENSIFVKFPFDGWVRGMG
jgi:hypothetical protein